jgi:hypothetical protein
MHFLTGHLCIPWILAPCSVLLIPLSFGLGIWARSRSLQIKAEQARPAYLVSLNCVSKVCVKALLDNNAI